MDPEPNTSMSETDLNFVLESAKKRGYNTQQLIWVEHKIE